MRNVHNVLSDTLEDMGVDHIYNDSITDDPNDPLKFIVRISAKVNPNDYFTFGLDLNVGSQKTMLLESQNIGRTRILQIMTHFVQVLGD